MARALGSYPKGRGFKSNFRYHDNLGCHAWPGGQAAKTPPFHGGNTGSIPVRVTTKKQTIMSAFFLFIVSMCGYPSSSQRFDSCPKKSKLFRKLKLIRIYFFTIIIRINANRTPPRVTNYGYSRRCVYTMFFKDKYMHQ